MLCKIAELIADVPAADGLAIRCRDYLYTGKKRADITIRTEFYRPQFYGDNPTPEMVAYMESASQFYGELVKHNGFFLHASAVVKDGKAYLFSGDSGVGKSTHANLWIQTLGGDTRIINDDKPALRKIDGVWYAYGTPWCGKDGINLNEKAPIAGVCFMKQAGENSIHRLNFDEAMKKILQQTLFRFDNEQLLDAFWESLSDFLEHIPVYELENRPEPAAAQLSFQTMQV